MRVFNYKSILLFLLGCLFTIQFSYADNGGTPSDARTAFLGVKTNDISETKMEVLGFNTKYGEYISYVFPNSPAEKGGLSIFDYIIEVDGRKLNRQRRLSDALSYFQAGDKINITFVRNGITKDTKLELVRRSDVPEPMRPSRSEAAFLGVKQSSDYGYNRDKGVKVNIVRGSSANEMELRNGDFIFSIDLQYWANGFISKMVLIG